MQTVAYLLGAIAIAIVLTGCGEPQKYQAGKDTVDSFGDGNWRIVKIYDGPDNSRRLHLCCAETRKTLMSGVIDWRDRGDWLYATDSTGTFAVVNFRTSEHALYKAAGAAPPEHQRALEKLRTKQ